ncbi:MAG: hypothetical protein Q9163_000702 [Psora crenata]
MVSMPTSSRPTIPFTSQAPSQAGNNTPATAHGSSSSLSTNIAPSTASQPPPASQQISNLSSRRTNRSSGALSFANGIGTLALIAAVVFGIGAWVGMKIQISQGGKNMDLAIWTACVDHEAIQDTKLCKTIMSKDFSQFEKSEEEKRKAKDVAIVVKRGTDDYDSAVSDRGAVGTLLVKESKMEKLISKIPSPDRSLIENINAKDIQVESEHAPRATLFPFLNPLVNPLVKPISWIFEFVEYMLLVLIYCVHKVFPWMSTVIIIGIQAYIYSLLESFIWTILSKLDGVILQSLPSWIPFFLFGDLATLLCLSALRGYWYSTSFLTSLKWCFFFRTGLWLIVRGVEVYYLLWKTRQLAKSSDRVTASSESPE